MCEGCGCHGDGHDRSDGHDHADEHEHGHEDAHGHEHEHTHDHGHDHHHRRTGDGSVVDTDGTVRIAVTGKGGVGKSTLSAAIARHLADSQGVVAVDADPDMNLATTLGVEAPPPVTDERDLIEERAGSGGGLVTLTPEVEDVLDSHSTPFGEDGRLLTIGAPAAANSGCMCPENSFVRSLVASALEADHVVMDMEAGVEHLGRGTAGAVDAMVVVVEPSRASIETAGRIRELADELGVDEVRAVVNRARGNADVVRDALEVPVVASLPYDEDVADAGLAGESPVAASERLRDVAADVVRQFRTRPAASAD